MAATIIQFPQTHSNIFLNLTQLINLASNNQVVEEYAEIMAVCHEEGNFKPGEIETLQEQIRTRRLENARPEEKPEVIPEKPGLYCYTPEMGEQKPKCQIEAERSYYGRHYHINTPLELKGRGIKKDGVKEAKNLRPNYQYMAGWFEYTVTERAFEKLQEQYTISQELLLDLLHSADRRRQTSGDGESMGNMKPMLLTNNQRKMHGLTLWRKKNRKKRLYTRCEADETITAFIDYCNQE